MKTYLILTLTLFAIPQLVTAQEEQFTPEELILKSELKRNSIQMECYKAFSFDCFDDKSADIAFEVFDAYVYAAVKQAFIEKLLATASFDYPTYILATTTAILAEAQNFSCTEWGTYIQVLQQRNAEHIHDHADHSRGVGDPCTNPDFENCDFTNWELYTGAVNGTAFSFINTLPTVNFSMINNTTSFLLGGNHHAIVSGGNDAVGGFPMVYPGGSCSALVGDFKGTGAKASMIRQTFLVSSADAVLTLNYAAVLQDPNHSINDQPYFKVRLYDGNGNSLGCGEYEAFAGDGQAGWQQNLGVSYLPWTTVLIPLNSFIGQNITAEFTTGDCDLGGHYGYAYVDASCEPISMDFTGTADCQFPITLNAPSGGASYVWNTGATTQSITINGPGNYGVTIIPAAGPQCSIYLDTTITGFDPLPVNAGPDKTICEGDSVQITGHGTGAFFFNWNNASTLSDPAIPDPFASPTVTTTYTLTAQDSAGCDGTDNMTVTVVPFSDATITPQSNLCDNWPAVILQGAEPGGTWTGNGIVNSVTGEFDPSVAGAGNHTITYAINSMCPDSQTIDVLVEPYLDPTITQVGPFCETDADVNLQAVDPGGIWTGTGITDATAGIFSPQLAGAGIHTIAYETPGLCGDIDSIDILVAPIIDATITPAGPLCSNGAPITLQGATAGGSWSGNGITDTLMGIFDPLVTGPGLHTVTYTVTQICTDVKTLDILVYPPLESWISNDTLICSYGVATISVGANGGSGNYAFNWDNSLGSATSYNVTPPITTTYSVEITDGCEIIHENVTVEIEPVPTVVFEADTLTGCVPMTVNLSNLSVAGSVSCIWTVSNGHVEDDCAGIQTVLTAPGCYDVNLQLTSPIGCIVDETYFDYICAQEYPIAQYSINPVIMSNADTEAEFTNTSQGAVSYLWSFGDLSPTSTVFEPVHVFPDQSSQNYLTQLIATSSYGCRDTARILVQIEEELIFYVPNVFTPDGDDYNETWKPVFYSGYDPNSLTIYIFNRWGELVWESHDPESAWNGHYKNGGLVDDGVYIWTMEFNDIDTDERYRYEGHVVVLK